MSNIREKFEDCLQAVKDKMEEGQPQVQGGFRMMALGDIVVPQTSNQGERSRLLAGSILRSVVKMQAKKEETASDDLGKKIAELEQKLVQVEMDLCQEKQQRLEQEGKVIDLECELDTEKNLRMGDKSKIKKLEEELKVETDKTKILEEELKKGQNLKLPQEQKFIEKQAELNEEKKIKKAMQVELSKKKTELDAARETITENEERVKMEQKLRMEAENRLARTGEELKELEKELRATESKKVKEMEDKLGEERKKRKEAEDRLVKSEERCAELGRKLSAELHKGAAKQTIAQEAAKQKKPQLTKAEQQKYGEQLLAACGYGGKHDVSAVRRLLSLGVNCDVRDWFNWTPLHYAAQSGHADICQLLLDAAPTLVNVRDGANCTPLHIAARHGHLSVVRLLVLHNADRGLRDIAGQTALDMAVMYKHKQVTDYLTQLT